MSIRMLKITPVLFVLIALIIGLSNLFSNSSVGSSNNGKFAPKPDTNQWSRVFLEKKCKGITKYDPGKSCKDITNTVICSTAKRVSKVTEVTEGCKDDGGAGYICFEADRKYIIGSIGCEVRTITSEDSDGEITVRLECGYDHNDADHKVSELLDCSSIPN